MATFHCELAWLGDDRAAADVLVTVEGDRISAVEVGATALPDSTRLPGLTLPGLANAHSHAFHRALRGRTQAGSGSFWTWREQMYALAARLDPDSYRALARATFAEMALAGVSCVGEFHYLHHQAGGVTYADPNAMGAAVAAAAAEAGLRITLLDTCYLQGGFDVAADETQRRFSDGDVLAWATRASAHADEPGLRIGAAVHSVRAVEPADIDVVAAWAAERDAPLHAHVSEQPAEHDQCVAVLGRTPMQVLADGQALDRPVHGGARHPRRRRRSGSARRRRRVVLPVPDHRARSGRRDRRRPGDARFRGPADPGQRFARRDRPARGGARRRARRAAGQRHPRQPRRGVVAAGGDRGRPRQPRVARRRAHRGRRAGRSDDDRARLRAHRRRLGRRRPGGRRVRRDGVRRPPRRDRRPGGRRRRPPRDDRRRRRARRGRCDDAARRRHRPARHERTRGRRWRTPGS